jgi:hypothetical protein
VADVWQVQAPEVVAVIAGVIEFTQSCALLYVLLPKAPDFSF